MLQYGASAKRCLLEAQITSVSHTASAGNWAVGHSVLEMKQPCCDTLPCATRFFFKSTDHISQPHGISISRRLGRWTMCTGRCKHSCCNTLPSATRCPRKPRSNRSARSHQSATRRQCGQVDNVYWEMQVVSSHAATRCLHAATRCLVRRAAFAKSRSNRSATAWWDLVC